MSTGRAHPTDAIRAVKKARKRHRRKPVGPARIVNNRSSCGEPCPENEALLCDIGLHHVGWHYALDPDTNEHVTWGHDGDDKSKPIVCLRRPVPA